MVFLLSFLFLLSFFLSFLPSFFPSSFSLSCMHARVRVHTHTHTHTHEFNYDMISLIKIGEDILSLKILKCVDFHRMGTGILCIWLTSFKPPPCHAGLQVQKKQRHSPWLMELRVHWNSINFLIELYSKDSDSSM